MSKKTQEKLDKVLNFIKSFTHEYGYPPTVREICTEINVTSSATAQYYLNKLEDQGLIRRANSKNRAIEVVGEFSDQAKPQSKIVPVVGKVAAGVPILATENVEETICLPQSMFSDDDLFILKVSGDSMVNSGILDGDKIVVRKQATAKNGEIVVALLEDSATVKRFYKEKDQFRLQPENDFMSPIYTKSLDILGIVVGLIRKF